MLASCRNLPGYHAGRNRILAHTAVRLLLRPLFRWIARSRTPEIFTAASLLLVVASPR
jgi:hypothetical protein